MSKFSGKCDFYDYIEIFGLESILSSNIYLGDNIVPLRIDTRKDCIPYYAHLISFSFGNTIILTPESFIDMEEKKHLQWLLKEAIKYYNKCKRSHISFNKEEALKKICFFTPQNFHKEIIERVAVKGTKADITDIHDDTHTYYRNLLYEELIKAGYSNTVAYYWLWHKYPDDDKLNKEV